MNRYKEIIFKVEPDDYKVIQRYTGRKIYFIAEMENLKKQSAKIVNEFLKQY